MASIKGTPGNKLHKRLNHNRLKLWFFMGGNRLLVAGLLVVAVFIMLFAAGSLSPAVENYIRSSDSVDTLFQALLTAIISGVTIVVSLNQLVLSQELGAVKDQRERMEGALQFRKDVADIIPPPVSPSRPSQFIRILIKVAAERAKALQDLTNSSVEENLKQEISNFTSSLIKNSKQVAEELDAAQFGEFDVISSALNFNYSWKIFTARRIKKEFSDSLSQREKSELEKLIEVLNLFGPTREHFKTLYFQSDLIDLSRRILLAALPALLVSCYMIIFFNAKTYNINIFNSSTLVFFTALNTTISLLPFLILISYVFRIATITKHTLSIGPFILRETDQVEEIEGK